MSADIQLIDDTKIVGSIIRDFIKINHQHGAQVNTENQNIKFYFGENLNFIRVGDGDLELEMKMKKSEGINFTNPDDIRLVNNGLAYVFKKADCLLHPGRKYNRIST